MATTIPNSTAVAPHQSAAPVVLMLWHQTSAEVLSLLRTPSFLLSSLTLPILLFAFFGATRSGDAQIAGVSASAYVLASFATYGVVSVMLYSFGVRVAVERGQRVQVLMRATPLPGLVAVLAKVLTALLFALVMLLALCVFAATWGGVQLAPGAWASLIGRLLAGAIPFIGLGLAIGYRASPTAAAPITNLLFLLLSFASGIFVPINALPDVIQHLAADLPLYWMAQLAWNAVGAQTPPLGDALRWLLIYGVVFAFAALNAYRREARHLFG